MIKRAFNWLKNKVKSFLGATVLLPAKALGFVADSMTSASLWLYRGTDKHNEVAEKLSIMYADLSDQYAELINYSDVIEEINEAVEEESEQPTGESEKDESPTTDFEPVPTT